MQFSDRSGLHPQFLKILHSYKGDMGVLLLLMKVPLDPTQWWGLVARIVIGGWNFKPHP